MAFEQRPLLCTKFLWKRVAPIQIDFRGSCTKHHIFKMRRARKAEGPLIQQAVQKTDVLAAGLELDKCLSWAQQHVNFNFKDGKHNGPHMKKNLWLWMTIATRPFGFIWPLEHQNKGTTAMVRGSERVNESRKTCGNSTWETWSNP